MYIILWAHESVWPNVLPQNKCTVGHCDLYFMVQWFCLIPWRLSDVRTSLFGILSRYDLMFDLKIKVSHCDLYFMVQWFCLIFWILFDVWPSLLARLNNVQEGLLYYRRHRHPQMLKFYVKVFTTSLFPNSLMDLIHIWYDDRYWSKILQGTIPTPRTWSWGQSNRLRMFMLKFCVTVFRTSLFINPLMDLVHVWYDDRHWSKILRVPSPPWYMTLRSRSWT